MALKVIDYTDPDGRTWKRGLPDGVPDSQASVGVPIGPPPLDDLKLPKDISVRLHNELHARGILTEKDARKRLADVQAALAAALRVNVQRILAAYSGTGSESISDKTADRKGR